MFYNIEIYFMLFIIYAFLGWIMECTLNVINRHKFVNRGFLIGPICPIYGVGVVGVTLLFSNFKGHIILLFLLSTLICGILEYATSYGMEKIFHARWWDYSQKKFNINGRVCLNTLIPFGILSILILRFLNPIIISRLHLIPNNILTFISISIAIIYIIDTCISFKIISNFKNLNKQAKDSTEEISKKVREVAEAALEKINIQKNQFIRKVRINRYSIIKNIKYTRRNYAQKIKNQQFTLIEKFVGKSKLNKRLISAFPNVKHLEYTRKVKNKTQKKKGDN